MLRKGANDLAGKANARVVWIGLTVVLVLLAAGCGTKPPDVTFRFSDGTEGWQGYFAELPADYEQDAYELRFSHAPIPVEGRQDRGLLLQGHNRSDDLFMFIARRFGEEDGLKARTTYRVRLSFDLATNVAPGLIGIGGSPGGSVCVKAGVVTSNPAPVVAGDGYYRVSLDKGNPAGAGSGLAVLGNIEKIGSQDDSYEYKSFQHECEITAGDRAEAWVVIGTDSGFEGLTRLYYTNIRVTFVR